MAVPANLYMPSQGTVTTLNLCLNSFTNAGSGTFFYVGLIDTGGNYVASTLVSEFPTASGGSVSLGERTPIYVEGGTQQSPIIVEKIYLANKPHDYPTKTDGDYEEYDVSTINLTEAERTYDEIGTFVVDDITFELSIV